MGCAITSTRPTLLPRVKKASDVMSMAGQGLAALAARAGSAPPASSLAGGAP